VEYHKSAKSATFQRTSGFELFSDFRYSISIVNTVRGMQGVNRPFPSRHSHIDPHSAWLEEVLRSSRIWHFFPFHNILLLSALKNWHAKVLFPDRHCEDPCEKPVQRRGEKGGSSGVNTGPQPTGTHKNTSKFRCVLLLFFGNSPQNNFIFIVIHSYHMRHQPSGLRLTNVELIDELSLGFRGSTRVQALRY
jgi:hypothetical protein